MATGGIYDQVGGGFARYSVDALWLVPHFEKMLYDNALLLPVYLHAWQVRATPRFRRICEETLDWALREMRGPEGGFYSALDADSEGEEGRFYVWTADELRDLLGDDADRVLRYWGVDRGPNFEGRSILHVAGDEDIDPEVLERARRTLYEARSQRVWPGLDDKRLTAWNALMISALATAGAALDRPDYTDAARTCAGFILETMRDEQGRLLRTYKDGQASIPAYLEDHAFMLEALLGALRGHVRGALVQRRSPPGRRDQRALLGPRRRRLLHDALGPAGSHRAAPSPSRTTRSRPATRPRPWASCDWRPSPATLQRSSPPRTSSGRCTSQRRGTRRPSARLLAAMHFYFGPRREVALVGDDLAALARVVRAATGRSSWSPAPPPGHEAQHAVPLLRDRTPVDGRPAAYVCENFACRLPVTEPRKSWSESWRAPAASRARRSRRTCRRAAGRDFPARGSPGAAGLPLEVP